MRVREEMESDWPEVFAVNQAAFDTPAEANLVNSLREQCHPIVSLVAEEGGTIIGHILFSPVHLSGHTDLRIMGLAPMAVLPDTNGKGSALL